MKNSGIEWIEGLPDTWQEIPNRYLFIDHSKKVGEQWKDYQLLSLTTSGVKEKDVNVSGGKVPDSYENYQTVEKGDMVFCLFDLDCSAVFSGLSNYNGMITSAYDVFMPNHKYLDDLYADYWFQYVFSNRYYKMYSKNIRYTITGEMFKSVLTPIPSLEEQKKIGAYLLEKDKQITKLIANQEKQIEKLKEYKQSVITEAVTKGLDKSVPLKDSGIEWIGKIPESWEVKKIKYLFEESSDRNIDLSFELLTFSGSKGLIRFAEHTDKLPSAEDLSNYKVIHKGQLCMNRMQAWHGMFIHSNIEGCVSPDYAVYIPLKNTNVRYYSYVFRTPRFVQQFANLSKGIGTGFNRLYTPAFFQVEACYPSKKEQDFIVDYLDDKCGKIDSLIAIKQEKIEKLQEYKKSLIYEYVTGKKEVV